MKKLLSLIAASFALCGAVQAQTPFSGALLSGQTSYVGPGDLVLFTAWYGIRGYNRAAAASGTKKMMQIRKPASGELCDVLVSATGGEGLTTGCTAGSNNLSVSTFCAGADCTIRIMYDQTENNSCGGSSCDLIQATAANQPLLRNTDSFLKINFGNVAISVVSANSFTPSAAKLSFVGIAAKTAGIGVSKLLTGIGNLNELRVNAGSNTAVLAGGSSGSISVAAVAGTTYAEEGVINGASSSLTLNGATTTGTAVASTSAGTPTVSTPSGTSFTTREMGFIDNYALTAGEIAALNSNMRDYWSF